MTDPSSVMQPVILPIFVVNGSVFPSSPHSIANCCGISQSCNKSLIDGAWKGLENAIRDALKLGKLPSQDDLMQLLSPHISKLFKLSSSRASQTNLDPVADAGIHTGTCTYHTKAGDIQTYMSHRSPQTEATLNCQRSSELKSSSDTGSSEHAVLGFDIETDFDCAHNKDIFGISLSPGIATPSNDRLSFIQSCPVSENSVSTMTLQHMAKMPSQRLGTSISTSTFGLMQTADSSTSTVPLASAATQTLFDDLDGYREEDLLEPFFLMPTGLSHSNNESVLEHRVSILDRGKATADVGLEELLEGCSQPCNEIAGNLLDEAGTFQQSKQTGYVSVNTATDDDDISEFFGGLFSNACVEACLPFGSETMQGMLINFVY
ncbi:unnamed protein product [Protopolystoma xenopodis]|uniref:Uncharacterized protein n=1 Tax=Protopolystoma xenopodis TaxID=117903 RepID=A0A3S5BTW5_9PLAT|nr:unnamed protein product [Protopolystoma xenopodis]